MVPASAHLYPLVPDDGDPDLLALDPAAGALVRPRLGEAGQLRVPGDQPHVGRGGDAGTSLQGSIGDLAPVAANQTNVNITVQ